MAVRYEEGREQGRKELQGVVAETKAELADSKAEIERLRLQLAELTNKK